MNIVKPPHLPEAFAHARLVHRIYHDPRPTRLTRQLLLAIAYTLTIYPAPSTVKNNDAAMWELIETFLDQHEWANPYRRYSLSEHIRDDAPRYEIPPEFKIGTCAAPRKRARKPLPPPPATNLTADPISKRPHPPQPDPWICATPTRHMTVMIRDPHTGQVSFAAYCKRHTTEGKQHQQHAKEQNKHAPTPIPNRGGILPSYFTCDWESVYTHHVTGWKPPTYGICADDWPTHPHPTHEPELQRPRLVLVHSR